MTRDLKDLDRQLSNMSYYQGKNDGLTNTCRIEQIYDSQSYKIGKADGEIERQLRNIKDPRNQKF